MCFLSCFGFFQVVCKPYRGAASAPAGIWPPVSGTSDLVGAVPLALTANWASCVSPGHAAWRLVVGRWVCLGGFWKRYSGLATVGGRVRLARQVRRVGRLYWGPLKPCRLPGKAGQGAGRQGLCWPFSTKSWHEFDLLTVVPGYPRVLPCRRLTVVATLCWNPPPLRHWQGGGGLWPFLDFLKTPQPQPLPDVVTSCSPVAGPGVPYASVSATAGPFLFTYFFAFATLRRVFFRGVVVADARAD